MDMLTTSLSTAHTQNHNHSFVLTHYPPSIIAYGVSSDLKTIDDVSGHISVWFSGHLHKLFGGLGNRMWVFHHLSSLFTSSERGFLDLEVCCPLKHYYN